MIIYKVTNSISGKIYIGFSIKELEERKRAHYYDHKRKDYKFYKALRKYDECVFAWEVIDYSNSYESIKEMEVAWIYHYDSYNNGYNSTVGGDGPSSKMSSDTIDKLRLASTGRFVSDDTRRKIGIKHKGKKLSKEQVKGLRGENNKQSVLTNKDVISIRSIYKDGKHSQSKLASMFNVSQSLIGGIIRKTKWKHI